MVDDTATELASRANAQRWLNVVVPLLEINPTKHGVLSCRGFCGQVVYPTYHSWNDEPIVAGRGEIPVLIPRPWQESSPVVDNFRYLGHRITPMTLECVLRCRIVDGSDKHMRVVQLAVSCKREAVGLPPIVGLLCFGARLGTITTRLFERHFLFSVELGALSSSLRRAARSLIPQLSGNLRNAITSPVVHRPFYRWGFGIPDLALREKC